MRPLSIFLIILALLAGGAYFGAPWYVGQQVSQQRDALIFKQDLESAGLVVEEVSYKTGLRQSEAVYQIGADGELLKIKQTIEHGPLLTFNAQPQNGFALVNTRLYSVNGQALPAHNLQSFLDWDGNMQNRLSIPEGLLQEDTTQISWQPITVAFNINADQSLDYQLNIQGLEASGPETTLILGEVSSQGQQSSSTLAAQGSLTVQSLSIAPFANLVNFSQKIALHDADTSIGIESHSQLEQLEILGQTWKNAEVSLNFSKLDKEAIATIQANAGTAGANPMLVLQVLPKLLAASPEISIPNASVDSPEGRIEANLLLTIDGSKSFISPTALVEALTVDGDLRLPEIYAVFLLSQSAAPGSPNDPEIAQEKLRKLSDMGALIRRNGDIIVQFRLHRGGLSLNDNPFDLAEIASILQ